MSTSAESLVSCLCVTRNRVPLLRRAVACFLQQSYHPRELVVVFESDDAATRDYLATLNEPAVSKIEIPCLPKQRLGTLRNLALAAAQGRYVAQWDDDDWYAPDRLTAQIGALRQSGRSGCLLPQWIIFDDGTKRAYLSAVRTWEGSMVALRSAVPPYPDLAQGEDTPVIKGLLDAGQLAFVNQPYLYVYVNHGGNTWDRTHFETNLLPHAQPLPPETATKIRQVLEAGASC